MLLGIADGIMPFLVIVVVLNLGDIFHFLLNGIGVSTYCRGVGVMSTFTVSLTPRISLLVVLVLFANLALVSKRLLVLASGCVSKRNVSGLSLFGVFFLFYYEPIP